MLQEALAPLPDDPRERIVIALSIASGFLHVVGYGIAIVYAVLGRTQPHPLTWFMFSYGTALIFVLEMNHGADWPLLILPAVCAICSLAMVAIIWFRGGYSAKADLTDMMVFGFDVILTIVWGIIWVLMDQGILDPRLFYLMNVAIICLWTVGVATSFTPMIRDTRAHPEHERSLPWFVWTAAYGALFIATIFQYWNFETKQMDGIEYLLYPGINLLFHLVVGIEAMKRKAAPVVSAVIKNRKPARPLTPKPRP